MAKNHFRLPALLILLLFGGKSLWAQVEVNVRLKSEANALRGQLKALSDNPAAFSRTMKNAAPIWANLTQVQELAFRRPQKSTPAGNIYTLTFQGNAPATQIASLMATGQFEWVEENRQHPLHVTAPNDPNFEEQWFHEKIGTLPAWDITRGNPNVVIGILDTGLDYDHPELEGQIAVNVTEDLNGNGKFDPWPFSEVRGGVSGDLDRVDADGNGFVDDVIGYDFTDQPRSPFGGDYLFQDPDPLDENTHGTLVAGIAVAKDNNNLGGAGVAPGCRVMALRAFAATGSGEDDDIARAIIYAADNGVSVLNFSFGDIYPSRMMHEAIEYAYQKGVVMIGSAGNGTGDEIHYPSGFDEVISVSATALGSSGSEFLWPLSSFGVTVDLAAPGSGIYTTALRDSTEWFGTFSGTSTSAPMVSAAAALLISQRGPLSPEQIRGLLTTSAHDISPTGWDHFTGAGRLNIYRALNEVGGGMVKILSPANDHGSAQDTLWIGGTVLHPLFQSWELQWQEGVEGLSTWNTLTTSNTTQILNDTLAYWDLTALSEGEYTLRLKTNLSDGNSAEDRIRFVVDRTPPQLEIKVQDMAWDNDERKFFLVFRASDIGTHKLYFRQGTGNWRTITADRMTRNGEFLLGKELLQPRDVEYYLSSTNLAGLTATTPIDTGNFLPITPISGLYESISTEIPMGSYLPTPYDMDGDGLLEVVMSEYNEALGFGPTKIYEYNGGIFSPVATLSQRPILIPKDVQDADGDGLQELLCSVNDSLYIVEQPTANTYPSQTIYSHLGQNRYAARWADPDNDGQLELLSKDFKDYYISERIGATYQETDTLLDVTPDYDGSIAPRVIVADNDGDGQMEVIFGDFDGDMLVYEYNGNGYDLILEDTTKLQKGGAYLTEINLPAFKGVFSAIHSNFLRNDDFEYDPGYWVIRLIGVSTSGSSYIVGNPIYLYDVDLESYNAATTADIDDDGADEVIFTTFPRTYVFDFEFPGGISWFHYGDLCTDHVVGDFNNNGLPEFALGRGDKAIFYENAGAVNPAESPAVLQGTVLGPNTAQLDWLITNTAPNTEIRIWRGPITQQNTVQIALLDSVNNFAATYTDTTLIPNQDYLYVVQRRDPGSAPGAFSNFVVLQGHQLGKLDSARALNDHQVLVHFSVPIAEDPSTTANFNLDGNQSPTTVIPQNDPAYSCLLTFENAFSAGNHVIIANAEFRDAGFAPLDTNSRTVQFTWNPQAQDQSFLTEWHTASDKEAILRFNYPMQANVLDLSHYSVEPYGTIAGIAWEGSDQQEIRITMQDVRFGALGYPISIVITGVSAQNGAPINEESGNVATFLSSAGELEDIFVYPNPVHPQELFEGLRFANLPPQAEIRIFAVSGQHVRNLTEADGDGGLTWDLLDNRGQRIRPGKYLFEVTTPDGATFIGKFALLDE